MLMLCSADSSLAGTAARRIAAELVDRLRVDLSGPDVSDPSRRLVAAAHATGCDTLVVGYTLRSGLETASTPGWQRRVVRDTLCPFMLHPAGARPLSGGGLVLGCGAVALPREAVTTATRLARRLQTPLILTDVLAGETHRSPVRPLHRACRLPWDEPPPDEDAHPAVIQEAALVVIAGRHRGRRLLPRRNVRHGPLPASNRLPAIVAVTPGGTMASRR